MRLYFIQQDRDLLDDFDVESFERGDFSGVVGQQANAAQIQIGKNLCSDADFALRENMVVSIEVFFQRAGVGQAGFENNVIVTRDGAELLSCTPMLF